MLKYGALLFNTIALLIYQFFFADGITVTQNIPSSAKADSEFTVELTINKGTIGGFAKLQQELPEGFTAVQEENSGGSFTFSNQAVKFIWMSLPSDKEFKVKYKVRVAAGINGDKTIAGKFSYVTDNVKQSVDISPSIIKIEDGSSSEPVVINKIANPDSSSSNATNNKTATNITTEPSSLVCTRIVPENVTGDFTVEININKGNIVGFAKLVETLPAGFIATAGESQGASFTFNEGKVKYVWVTMPTIPEFKISYKVSIDPATTGNQNIEGVFSYIENDETKKYTIPTSAIVVNPSQTIAANTPFDTVANKTNITPPDNTTIAVTPDNTATDNSTKSLSATTIPSPQGNVNYKVQIAALRKAVDADKLATRFKINQRVETEMAEGFTKYLVGSHAEYKSAHDSRETIKSKGVNDAFVTAYNSGKRITVQEALMITSQKWYR